MKKIPLAHGYEALVDDADFERVATRKWHVTTQHRKDGSVRAYARWSHRMGGGRRIWQPLHRFILGVTKPSVLVDHINGNGLDNRRANLRICTTAENGANRRGAQSNSKAGIRGVCWDRGKKKWKAQIGVKGKYVWLGRFDTKEAAASAYAYADAARKYFGEFASNSQAPA